MPARSRPASAECWPCSFRARELNHFLRELRGTTDNRCSEEALRQLGFVGAPHYFGDNENTTRKNQNQAELKRRRAAGYCFKCRMSDVKEVPFLECPLHGALATAANAPTVGRTKTHRAPRHT